MSTPIYDSRNIQYKSPFGAVRVGNEILFKIKPHRTNAVLKAYLAIQKEGKEPLKIPMIWCGIESGGDLFACSYTPDEIGLYWYSFVLENCSNTLYVIKNEHDQSELADIQSTSWQLTVYRTDFDTPEWLKGGILYQIFPDRFYKENCAMHDIPKDRELREDWGATPCYDFFNPDKKVNNDYFGGNLKGIIAKLEYLSDLGVSAIYLNPIFEAHSNHRYNTADFSKVDPLLGTHKDFKELCDKAEEFGIRILVDGVFNHVGDDSVYFNRFGRYKEIGAYQSEESKYIDWFNFLKWPEEYRSWWGIQSLPEMNKMNEEYMRYLLGENGIVVQWMKEGAWGWRLDVVDELPDAFVKKLRETVKAVNQNAVIIGEVWEDASNKISYGQRREYLQGNELDSVMNYPFKEAIIGYMKDHNAALLNNRVLTVLENYPKPVVDVLMNLLSTHDTARIITRLRGESSDGKDYDWKANTWLSNENRKLGMREVAIAATILYFLPGVPCVYYGDEIGLEGYEDPFNRRCFDWNAQTGWLTEWYKKIGFIRKKYSILKAGIYQPELVKDGSFCFNRSENGKSIFCAVNMNFYEITLDKEANKYQKLEVLASLDQMDLSKVFSIPAMSCRVYFIQENKIENR